MRLLHAFVVAILVGGCGGKPAPAAQAPAAPAQAAAPQVVPLEGGANALWWDAASATLYLTDSNAAALLSWTDKGLAKVATVPAGTAGVSLGGIVRRADGATVIANFGFGKQGGLFVVAPGHSVTELTGLDPQRRRVGLAEAGGALYSAYFVGGMGGGKPAGGVASVTITGATASETELAGASTSAGFGKIVGVAANATTVYVSDQSQKAIFAITTADHSVRKLADVPGTDLLLLLPNGDLLTGSGATISRITPAGAVSPLPTPTFEQVRGLAYDAAGKRLFVVDHSLTPGSPDKLHILPL